MFSLLMTLACVPKQTTPTEVILKAQDYQLDFASLFDIRSSLSLYDSRVALAQRMTRVQIEPSFLRTETKDSSTEPWTRNMLLQHLSKSGSIVIAPVPPTPINPQHPCPIGGCFAPSPTAILRDVYFNTHTDEIKVIVRQGHQKIDIWIRQSDQEESICGEDFSLMVGYIEFNMLIQDVEDGRLLALIDEDMLLPAMDSSLIKATMPDYHSNKEAFCSDLSMLYNKELMELRSPRNYERAADNLMKISMAPVLPPPR